MGTFPDDYLRWRLVTGTLAEVTERLARFVEAGCTLPILRFASWDPMGQLRRAMATVIPALRDLSAPAWRLRASLAAGPAGNVLTRRRTAAHDQRRVDGTRHIRRRDPRAHLRRLDGVRPRAARRRSRARAARHACRRPGRGRRARGAREPDIFPSVDPKAIARVDVLRLRRNVGHQRAIAIGLAFIHAHRPCRAVVVMDADGEDRPSDVPRLLARLDAAGDPAIVFAERTRRSSGTSSRSSITSTGRSTGRWWGSAST